LGLALVVRVIVFVHEIDVFNVSSFFWLREVVHDERDVPDDDLTESGTGDGLGVFWDEDGLCEGGFSDSLGDTW